MFPLLLTKFCKFSPPRLTTVQPVQRAPAALDMDEETQLQLALSLSKEEHQQVGLLGVRGQLWSCCSVMLGTL